MEGAGLMERRTLPEKLRLELTEYAALLRSLRVNDLLDLSTRLTHDGAADNARWPLLPHDVAVPEWSLSEEVRVLAKAVLRQTGSTPDFELELDEDSRRLDPLPRLVTDFLTHALNMLVYHIPARPASMQNRITPVSWDTVVHILTSSVHAKKSSYISLRVLERAATRLEHIYGAPARSLLQPFDRPLHPDRKSLCPFTFRTALTLFLANKYFDPRVVKNIKKQKKKVAADPLPTVADLYANKRKRDGTFCPFIHLPL
ncbi:hypothetical protein MD484_g5844, partial [Candolleomyces efflorescens]